MKKKKKEALDDIRGPYSLPCSFEAFDGEVIKLSGHEFALFFNKYSFEDEYAFRERLECMDYWLRDKPYRISSNWLKYITQWLTRDEKSL